MEFLGVTAKSESCIPTLDLDLNTDCSLLLLCFFNWELWGWHLNMIIRRRC